eukprot:1442436-Pleurochrysis_carterae.AAC.3
MELEKQTLGILYRWFKQYAARLGAGSCAHDGFGGGHGCHLLTHLAQLVAQGGLVISNSDGLGAHGAALGVDGVLV